MDREASAESPRDPLEIGRIARDDQIVALERADDDRRVHDIAHAGASAGDARRPGAPLVLFLDPTAAEQAGQLGLRPASPHLTQDTGPARRDGGPA